ncbi:MAG: M20/M25/M40 family metallo-hydrolase [Bacteroidaceae bacterium]|nr:M20/M25/M40 family metallo-hydrolase [Bacteroidaceae bacterium]
MKKRTLLFLALICAIAITPCDAKKKDKTTPEQKGVLSINRRTAEAYVEFLASDALMGREAGTGHGHIAGEYLVSILKQMGANPLFEEGFKQPFQVYSSERRDAQFTVDPMKIEKLKKGPHRMAQMNNILAKIEGKNPEEIVVVGAHYDHLGYDPLLQGDKIFNGADDNASGVQAVLQILKAFMATGQQPEKTVIFAFWDGEEKGLFGSKYFVQNFPDIKKVKGYMNFDMIGRNNMEHRPQQLKYLYLAEDSVYATWLKEDINKYSLALAPDFLPSDDLSGGSDQVPFFNAGASIVWYHTDGHPDYHMPSDHAERINWNKMVDITKAAFLCLWKMANTDYN